MLIVVTGSSGRLGSAVVPELVAHGHDVREVDVKATGEPTRAVDLTNYQQMFDAMRGADAVCHLGNFPGFGDPRASEGFANNVISTFNVFQAAGQLGIRRVVNASSIQAYGIVKNNAAERLVPPMYLPIDEEHPLLASNPYGL